MLNEVFELRTDERAGPLKWTSAHPRGARAEMRAYCAHVRVRAVCAAYLSPMGVPKVIWVTQN